MGFRRLRAPQHPARAKPAAAALARSGCVNLGGGAARSRHSHCTGRSRARAQGPAPRGALDFALFYGVPENGQKGASQSW